MKTKKAQMKKKNNIFFGSRNKGDKRAIQVKGSWKAVELDPSLFSEEGMGGIVCFEELTDYRLMDSSKVGVKTSELNKKDKKAKKRKSSEIDDDDGGEVAEECEGEDEATETGKKQVKKKKKIKKVSGEESTKPDNIPLESSVSGEEKKEQPPCPKTDADDDTVEDGATEKKTLEEPPSSEIDAQSQSKTKKKKKKKQKKRQVDADNDSVEDGASEEKKLEEPASAEIDEKKLEEPASAEINAQSQSKTKKKKKKKQKKRQADADDDTVEVGASDETKVEEPTSSEMDARSQSKTENKNKMQKKKPEEKPTAPEAQTEQESQTDLDVQATEQPSQDQVSIIPQKKARNWSNGALSGSDQNTDVSAWKGLFVPAPVLKALSSLGFGSPTPIQALVLPPAIRDHMDIVGAAETGSGKTLSFGIPMIHHILEWKKGTEEKEDDDEQNKAITKVESLYIPDMDESTKASDDEDDNDGASVSSVEVDAEFTTEQGEGSIVDDEEEEDEGIAEEDKLDTDNDDEDQMEEDDDNLEEDGDKFGCVKVIENIDFEGIKETSGSQGQPLLGLVLTPTRELAVQVKHHIDAVAKFTGIKTALIVGGMAAQKQARMLKRQPEIVIATPGRLWELIKERNPHLQNLRQLQCLVIDEADRMVERGHFVELESLLEMLNTVHFNPKRQTFVFSATLTMAHSLPTRLLQKKRRLDKRSQLEILMEKVGIKSKPKVIDLTRKEATVETLIETKIHCDKDEKDFILYYFLLQYPGRTMVFANSIDCIKRLNSLLVILDRTPLPLHANMHQKQRLKNLERFAERESCVLLTTDVAARGLDIPNVQHVFHYQVPRTSETYVHRSGRTARAAKEGLSLLLIGPDDMMNFKKISKALGKDEDLPMFPIESKCMTAIKERVNLARKIEKIEYHNGKEKQHNSWFKKAAEALDMDLDDDLLLGGGQEEEHDREHQKMVKGMKKHLKHLLSQPVFKHEIKTKYPTQMGKLNLPQMRMETAITSVSNQKKKRKHKKEQPQQ